MEIFWPPWRELALLGWEAMQGVQQAYRRCWEQFLDQARVPHLGSDTAVLDEPLPAPYRRSADQQPDEIDRLVDEQLYRGMHRNGCR